jgi:hypothetical protein
MKTNEQLVGDHYVDTVKLTPALLDAFRECASSSVFSEIVEKLCTPSADKALNASVGIDVFSERFVWKYLRKHALRNAVMLPKNRSLI